jgi:hypothetical protein
MRDQRAFKSEVANYTGAESLTLGIGSCDGRVYIRLTEARATACLLTTLQVDDVRRALTAATRHVPPNRPLAP